MNRYKVHYFLWYAALAGVLPYYVVLVRNCSPISAISIGTIMATLPSTAFLLNPIFCTLADKYNNHQRWLISFMCLTLLGFGSLIILPYVSTSISWIIATALLLVAYPSMAISVSLTDSLVMKSVSKSSSANFGNVRVWGTIGYGIFGLVAGPLNEADFGLPYLIPGFIMFLVLLTIDIVALKLVDLHFKPQDEATTNEADQETKEKLHFKQSGDTETKEFGSENEDHDDHGMLQEIQTIGLDDEAKEIFLEESKNLQTENSDADSDPWQLLSIACSEYPTIIQHSIVLVLLGVLMAFHWSFFYWFLESVAGKDTRLMGFCMFVGCFVGEMPFFYFGSRIVKKLGASVCFNISMICFAFQYFSYHYFIWPGYQYYILLLEILQGPTFGLFYCAMTHIGQEYAVKASKDSRKKRLQKSQPMAQHGNPEDKVFATLQGLLAGCMEGLGPLLGAFLGGFIINFYSVRALWVFAGWLAVCGMAFNICCDFLRLLVTNVK